MNNKIFLLLIFILIKLNVYPVQDVFTVAHKDTGVILGAIVNVRKLPSTQSKIVTTVKENVFVKILAWQNKRVTIGRYKDRWVKIKTPMHKVGYIFGAFIFDLKDLFIGKWTYNAFPSDIVDKLKFNKNFTYQYKRIGLTRGMFSGKFKIKGRKLYLSRGYNQNSRYLYLMRYKGKQYLETKLKPISTGYTITYPGKHPSNLFAKL